MTPPFLKNKSALALPSKSSSVEREAPTKLQEVMTDVLGGKPSPATAKTFPKVNSGKPPSRFFLKAPGVHKGANNDDCTSRLVIVSAKPYIGYEHTLQDPKTMKWNVHVMCPKDIESGCPICSKNESYSAMFLTCIEVKDYRYTDDRGIERVSKHRLKTLVVKGKTDFFDDLFNQYGTLRGVALTMTRGSAAEPSIGIPTFDGMLSEEDLASHFGNREFVKDGVVVRPENFFLTAWEYYQERKTVAELLVLYPKEPVVGSMEWEDKQSKLEREAAERKALMASSDYDIPF